MARYIDLSDKAKAQVQLRDARKVDWDACLADLEAQAEAIKAAGASERKIARRLESLRIEYASVLRARHFAQTGINLAHVGLGA
jgi:hypothetical protein